ncbi:MAG: 1-deoxy-D-xylulose-5-phosphate synthase [Selenomonadaceae bacterium]|nr:1-deoxy-D-xylulose-5-phosphate synthase [Selenomonadaceae bacterium]
MTGLLKRLKSPAELQKMSLAELEELAGEIRELILTTVAKNGGHLAPSLGTVELTLALYSVFDFSKDRLIWDVGHQAYTHKILTGRRDTFHTLRTLGGITGFPKRVESPFDSFGVGHASTSISAALGLLIASEIEKIPRRVIAVIGDGALTGGMAFEALNHAGQLKKKLLVVLNDNEMSIDKNVGALSEYFSKIRLKPQFHRAKKEFEDFVKNLPFRDVSEKILLAANSVRAGVTAAVIPGAIFETLGFTYLGPIDGHDIKGMKDIFSRVDVINAPVLIHVNTTKGKGYPPAEISPEKFHGVGKFDKATGQVIKKKSPPSYTEIFSQSVIDLASRDEKIVAITAAMPSGTGLKKFAEKFPRRFFDVGIAEEHAVTLAAGMAAGGLKPVVAIYSTFMQRAYDQILHDICLQNLPVILCLDRAGLVGEDGATHHGAFDLAYLRTIPNMNILAPKDENELRQMIFAAFRQNKPVAIRYPRGAGLGVMVEAQPSDISWGKAEVIKQSQSAEVAVFAVGTMVKACVEASKLLNDKKIPVEVVNVRFVKPFDAELIKQSARSAKLLVTCEEGTLNGGFGAAVAEFLADEKISTPILRLGIKDEFIEQGTRAELLDMCGLTAEKIAQRILVRLNELIFDFLTETR